MQFKFYVLNSDVNRGEICNYNIFSNIIVRERTEKEVKKFLRNKKRYKYTYFGSNKTVYGFQAFCKELRTIIMGEEWSRCEYEILVGDLFEKDLNKFKKIDCYDQALPNIECIAREVIYQYKEQLKEEKKK